MVLLFQKGIPEIFFPALEKYGVRIRQFPTDPAAAQDVFRAFPDGEAVFFRANFPLGQAELNALPKLRLAALVSTGMDNVDVPELARRGVKLVTGEGANAAAVVDYVIQALLLGSYDPEKHRVGVVGAGRVGGKILRLLQAVNAAAIYYDPFLADPGSLDQVLQCDFVSFHVPLLTTGNHKTLGMLDAGYFKTVSRKIRIIQTCRGTIWEKPFYENLADQPNLELLAQDVYPVEPPQAADILRARYSTPHVAGYSTRGRLGGIVKGIQALFPDFKGENYYPEGKVWSLEEEARAFAANPPDFSRIRDNFPWRKEFSEFNAQERSAFRARYPHIGEGFFSFLFREI